MIDLNYDDPPIMPKEGDIVENLHIRAIDSNYGTIFTERSNMILIEKASTNVIIRNCF